MGVDFMDGVASILREVSATVIEPKFSRLRDEDVREKAPGELVTVVDEEAERCLTGRLREVLPGVPVVGEEACALDGSLAVALNGERAWLLDPLDGTSNFVSGSGDWAVMAALVEDGGTIASWIWQPVHGCMYMAERGGGASRNGKQFRRLPAMHKEAHRLRGAVLTRFLDDRTTAVVRRNRCRFGEVSNGHRCAGVDYPLLAEGTVDFVLFWRTLPWDHAPGVLLVQEAGGCARRLDGTSYSPTEPKTGLLAAADAITWSRAHQILE